MWKSVPEKCIPALKTTVHKCKSCKMGEDQAINAVQTLLQRTATPAASAQPASKLTFHRQAELTHTSVSLPHISHPQVFLKPAARCLLSLHCAGSWPGLFAIVSEHLSVMHEVMWWMSGWVICSPFPFSLKKESWACCAVALLCFGDVSVREIWLWLGGRGCHTQPSFLSTPKWALLTRLSQFFCYLSPAFLWYQGYLVLLCIMT